MPELSNTRALANLGNTAETLAAETLNVKDFGALGDGVANDSAAIAAVIAAANSLAYSERKVVFPEGIYRVDQFDLTGVSRVTFEALGTVQIVGIDGSKGWIFGSAVYSDGPDGNPATADAWVGDPPFNYNITVTGGMWLIGPAAGQVYSRGWSIEGFVSCVFENIAVSGEYGSAVTGDRTTATIEISFLNKFNLCQFGNPGTAAGGFTSWGVKNGSNNINANTMDTCRVVGAGETTASVGFGVSGDTNIFTGCDVSVVGTAFKFNAARSTQIINCYGERVGCVLDATVGNSLSPMIKGGLWEVATGGTAIRAGSCQGLDVNGGRWGKASGATGTTFINLGTACYGRTIRNIETSSAFDTWETGTEHGHGDLPSRSAEAVKTSRVMFPVTAVPSTNAYTLDDYAEDDTAVPNNVNVALTGKGFKFTKVGRMVLCDFRFTFPATADTNLAIITGIPARFAGHATSFGGAAVGNSIWPEDHTIAIAGQTLFLASRATGNSLTNANCSGKVYREPSSTRRRHDRSPHHQRSNAYALSSEQRGSAVSGQLTGRFDAPRRDWGSSGRLAYQADRPVAPYAPNGGLTAAPYTGAGSCPAANCFRQIPEAGEWLCLGLRSSDRCPRGIGRGSPSPCKEGSGGFARLLEAGRFVMKRALEKMRQQRDQLKGVGLALQQIFEEDSGADAAMLRMISKLDSWDDKQAGRERA